MSCTAGAEQASLVAFMFKNLRTSTKLLLVCGMFVISIAATTAALVAEKQIAIAFARKELAGSRYLAIVRGIYRAILIQQNDPSFAKTSPDEILKAVDEFFDRILSGDEMPIMPAPLIADPHSMMVSPDFG